MKTLIITGIIAAGAAAAWSPAAWAQRGAGDTTGVARQATLPEVVVVTGTLEAVKIAPCEQTTGRATVGVHLLLATTAGREINLHLGPANLIPPGIDSLTVGDVVVAKAFRTDKLGSDEYVAQSLDVNGQVIALRGGGLRPAWAAGPGRGLGGGRGYQGGRGYGGRGAGRGRGPGNCPFATAQNPPYRIGPAAGPGRGPGPGRARGQGRGAGYGRGGNDQRANSQATEAGRGYGRGQGRGQGRRW